MRKMIFVFVAAACAVPALAASDNASQPGQPQTPKKEKKICKRVAGSESRIATSVCKTAAEWAQNPNAEAEGTRASMTGRAQGN
jgi:hypothetical protein